MRYRGNYSVEQSLDLLRLFQSIKYKICTNYENHLLRGSNRWPTFIYENDQDPQVLGTTNERGIPASFVDMIKIGLKYAK